MPYPMVPAEDEEGLEHHVRRPNHKSEQETDEMTETDRLEEIARRAAAATPGPWAWRPTADSEALPADSPYFAWWRLGGAVGRSHVRVLAADAGERADAAFIAHAREDVPWLLDRLERAERAHDAVRAALADLVEAMMDDGNTEQATRAHLRAQAVLYDDGGRDLPKSSAPAPAQRAT